MSEKFGPDYYERGVELGISGYSNYRWIPEMTIPMCHHLVQHLKIDECSKILDFGCAKGYVVKALHLLGYLAYGVDVSAYAVSQCDRKVSDYIKHHTRPRDLIAYLGRDQFTHIIAKDVLEHIPLTKLSGWLTALSAIAVPGGKLYVLVPLADNGRYRVPAYEHDKTHVIRENETWWRQTLEENGWQIEVFSHKLRGIKDNWASFKRGNAQVICRNVKAS